MDRDLRSRSKPTTNQLSTRTYVNTSTVRRTHIELMDATTSGVTDLSITPGSTTPMPFIAGSCIYGCEP